jgi:hypothetical protein
MNVVVIKRHAIDSWNPPPPTLLAITSDIDVARRWIQEEVDGVHKSGHTYMQGKDADWWLEQGVFSLTSMEVQA